MGSPFLWLAIIFAPSVSSAIDGMGEKEGCKEAVSSGFIGRFAWEYNVSFVFHVFFVLTIDANERWAAWQSTIRAISTRADLDL